MTGIYAVFVGEILIRPLSPSLLKFIDPEKRSRIMNFRRFEDANRTLYADLLVRSVLSSRTGESPVDLHFAPGPNGKPRLAEPDGKNVPDFNLSHSGEWVVCGIGDSPIGVDAEEIRAFDPATADQFFSDGEKDEFSRLAEDRRTDFFYQVWTLKESYAKAVGLGLGMALGELSVRLPPAGPPCLLRHGSPVPGAAFQTWRLDDRHLLSACSLGESLPDDIVPLPLTALLCYFS